jgi:formylglycine-generating enzyme required for sulfatase activity
MDSREISNADYHRFDPAHQSGASELGSLSGDEQPVVLVSWQDAVRYCNWRSRQEGLQPVYDESDWTSDLTNDGYRLPTEAQWEYAARGGAEGKRYVWGDGPPPAGAGSFWDGPYRWPGSDVFTEYDDGYPVSAPVGSFPPNNYGLYDMAGNVGELCHDWYEALYYSASPSTNPAGPGYGSTKVLRDGWLPQFLRVAWRGQEDYANSGQSIGFRCVRSLSW